ncbi:HNH endonuclease signature motif containing protein [Glaciibacter superstes]|uniref:HNH endonuclease signature motif containing protein n=1 Tax=Glaciibacter superstes TaxID=501023 RepID=UPI0003B489DF|nr:HNH endonuclease signature motif containing protein [Glaciibacter superstes]
MENNENPPNEAGPPGDDPDPSWRPDPEQARANASFRSGLGGLIDAIAKVNRKLAKVAAKQAIAVEAARAFAERTDQGVSATTVEMAKRSLVAEVACATRVPQRTAENLIGESRALVQDLPDTLTALRAGKISYRHARTLVSETAGLDDAATAELEKLMLPVAETVTGSKFDRKIRIAREKLNPESIVARHERSILDRRVSVEPARDGMAWLSAYLPAADALAIHTQLVKRGKDLQGANEHRTLTQLKADVFRDLLLCPNSDGSGETAGTATGERLRGVKPDVFVTVPMLTLFGMSEEPGNLDGYGPIDPDTARDLAAKCPSFVRILTHPETGAVLSVGRDRYLVPADLRRLLQLRDGTCRFPGCSRQAALCDVDHSSDWGYGGETEHINLAHLCKSDHTLKHGAGWKTKQADDGSGNVEWTTPTGHRYETEPETPIASAISAELRKKALLNKWVPTKMLPEEPPF